MSLKAIAEVVGFSADDESKITPEAIKQHLDENYILRENAVKDPEIKNKITGAFFGSLGTKAAQTFGLKSSEVKDKPIEEIFELAKTKFENEFKVLKETAGNTDDEKIKGFERTIQAKDASIADLEKALEGKDAEYGAKIGELSGSLKNVKLNTKLEKAFSTVPFTDEYHKDTLKKQGFGAIINSKYKVDIDDADNITVTDLEGKPVKHPKKTGHYASFDDVLVMEAEQNGLLKKNNATTFEKRGVTIGGDTTVVDTSKVNKKALEHAQKTANRGY